MSKNPGDYVLVANGNYGIVFEAYPPNPHHMQNMYTVKCFDQLTGKIAECNTVGCIGVCNNCVTTCWEEDLIPMTTYEIEVFKQDKLIVE